MTMVWTLATALLALGSLVPPAAASSGVAAGAPGAPTGVVASPGIGGAVVSWTPPADTGTSPITSYDVISSTGLCRVSVPASQTSVVVTGLPPFAMTFTVDAVNASGAGPASAPSAQIVVPAGATYHPLDPVRILDTRTDPGGPLGPGDTRFVQVTGRNGVPATGVSAVVLNVTATNTTAESFLAVWPADIQKPLVSHLNWVPGATVANLVEMDLITFQTVSSSVALFNSQGRVDVVLDLQGYVGDSTNSFGADGMFNVLSPVRLLDTRNGRGPLGPGQTLDLQVTGNQGVPASGVSAVVLNVTVTDPTDYSFLTVWPSGSSRPPTSNMNFFPTLTVANRVMVKVGAGGRVSIFNDHGSTDVVVDTNGWFTDASSTAGGSAFAPAVPDRIVDTRTLGGPVPAIPPGQPIPLIFQNPLSPTAVAVNLTATDMTDNTFLTAWPDGSPRPPTSDLNPRIGRTVANFTVVGVREEPVQQEFFDVFNDRGRLDVIVDLAGTYTAVVPPLPGPSVVHQPCGR
jgi:Fibronectin type III domain